jgi:hypothetical protein
MLRWRKSSRSGANGQTACVEVAHDLRAVRDSKNPDGPVLAVDVRALLDALRAESV